MNNNALQHFQRRALERLGMRDSSARVLWERLPDLIARYEAYDSEAMIYIDYMRKVNGKTGRRMFSVNFPDCPRFAVIVTRDNIPVTAMTMKMAETYAPAKGAKIRRQLGEVRNVQARATALRGA